MKKSVSGRKAVVALAVATMTGFLSADAFGQACVGVPIARGSFAAQAAAAFEDDATIFSPSLTWNLAGPLSLGAGYGLATAGGGRNAHRLYGTVAFELLQWPVSVCALTGWSYSSGLRGDADDGGFGASSIVPVGLALSHGFPVSSTVTVTPYIQPQIIVWFSSDGVDADRQNGADQPGSTDTGWALRKGIAVGVGRFFAGADVQLGSLEGWGTGNGPRLSLGIQF